MSRLDDELVHLRERHCESDLRALPDGVQLLCLGPIELPRGWNYEAVVAAFVVPVAYPAAQPDCFYVEEDLKTAVGAAPQNSQRQALGGRTWTWFSWHLQNWRPGLDTLLTYARFVEMRLHDVR